MTRAALLAALGLAVLAPAAGADPIGAGLQLAAQMHDGSSACATLTVTTRPGATLAAGPCSVTYDPAAPGEPLQLCLAGVDAWRAAALPADAPTNRATPVVGCSRAVDPNRPPTPAAAPDAPEHPATPAPPTSPVVAPVVAERCVTIRVAKRMKRGKRGKRRTVYVPRRVCGYYTRSAAR